MGRQEKGPVAAALWISLVLGASLGAILLVRPHDGLRRSEPNGRPSLADRNSDVPKPQEADRLYGSNPKAAANKYQQFVEKYKASPEPVVQDQVGTARLKLGFLAAHQKDWKLARTEFLLTSKETKGTDRTGDFGTVNEQGCYEAIVCLEASGHKDEARLQYLEFLKTKPLSSLCMACYRRLKRLNGGNSTKEYDALIQSATEKQGKNAKFEASVCGPRTIEYMLNSGLIQPADKDRAARADYRSIAKLCRTTDSGTTIAGMIDGLRAFGISASAYRVNRQDLATLARPAILLWGPHYVVLKSVNKRSVDVYDTLTRSNRSIDIPAIDDPDFFINAIVLQPVAHFDGSSEKGEGAGGEGSRTLTAHTTPASPQPPRLSLQESSQLPTTTPRHL